MKRDTTIKNYFWTHGYDTSDLPTLYTHTQTIYGHKKEAARYDLMGGYHSNKTHAWKKDRKKAGGDDQKHSSLNYNGKIYNGFDNAHVFSNLDQAPNTRQMKISKRGILSRH